MGAALAVLACLAWAATGGAVTARLGTSLPLVVAADLLGGLVAGTIVHLTGGWVTAAWRAAIVGVCAAAPLALLMRLALRGTRPFDGADFVVLPLWALGMGGLCGIGLWNVFGPNERPPARGPKRP